MAKDVFLVDTGVITLVTLEWLLALVVEHVLLQNTQTDRRVSEDAVRAAISQGVCGGISTTGTLSEDQRLQR